MIGQAQTKREPRTGSRDYYRGKFFIVFYDETDEIMMHMFNNVREILAFQCKEVTRTNVNLINVELVRALKREGRDCWFLTGEHMKVYLITTEEE